MSNFVESCIKVDATSPGAIHWSRVEGFHFLALRGENSSKNDIITVFSEVGKVVDVIVGPIHNAGAEVLFSWNPKYLILSMVWSDFQVAYWIGSESKTTVEKGTQQHSSSVYCIDWSPDGELLISIDRSGKFIVWTVDQHGRPHVTKTLTDDFFCAALLCFHPHCHSVPENESKFSLFCMSNSEDSTEVSLMTNIGQIQSLLFHVPEICVSFQFDHVRNSIVLLTRDSCLLLYHNDCEAWILSHTYRLSLSFDINSRTKLVLLSSDTFAVVGDYVQICSLLDGDAFILGLDDSPERICTFSHIEDENTICTVSDSGILNLYSLGLNAERVFQQTAVQNIYTFHFGRTIISNLAISRNSIIAIVGREEVGPSAHICLLKKVYPVYHYAVRSDFEIIVAYMKANNTIRVSFIEQERSIDMETNLSIKMLRIQENNLMVWSGCECEVFEFDLNNSLSLCKFEVLNIFDVCLLHESIIFACKNSLLVYNLKGVLKQTIQFTLPTADTNVLTLVASCDILSLYSKSGNVLQWQHGAREIRRYSPGTIILRLQDKSIGIRSVTHLCINCDATALCAIVKVQETGNTDHFHLCVHRIDSDSDFVNERIFFEPSSVSWDVYDPRILLVIPQKNDNREYPPHSDSAHSTQPYTKLTVYFVKFSPLIRISEVHEQVAVDVRWHDFISLKYPHILYLDSYSNMRFPVVRSVCVSSVGGADISLSAHSIRILACFTHDLIYGEENHALQCIAGVNSTTVNILSLLAKISLRHGNIRVCSYCLSKSMNFTCLGTLRRFNFFSGQGVLDVAQKAIIASHLGMHNESHDRLMDASLYHLCTEFLQAAGKWNDAVRVAEEKDRIHMQNIQFLFARHFEEVGRVDDAIKLYKLNYSSQHEVFRLLLHNFKLSADVEKIIPQNLASARLWAHYFASNGCIDEAYKWFEKYADIGGMVDIVCKKGEPMLAVQKVQDYEGNRNPGSFKIARCFEVDVLNFSASCSHYENAAAMRNALQIAMVHDLYNHVERLGLSSTNTTHSLIAARYLEKREVYDGAVSIYLRAREYERAIKICFKAELFDTLLSIIEGMNSASISREMLHRCTEFLIERSKFSEAVSLFLANKEVKSALDLSLSYNVILTEDILHSAAFATTEVNDDRRRILCEVADVCEEQGSFKLAAKIFTLSGDKVQAMKALIRDGDTDKVVRYAAVSRVPEIYHLAANYLQTLDWYNEPEIMKNIISFFTKARAMDKLCNFYELCAQIEIDEYRDYEKGLEALREALRYATKGNVEQASVKDKIHTLNQKIKSVSLFLAAKSQAAHSLPTTLDTCNELLLLVQRNVENESVVRAGDVYALMVEFEYSTGSINKARELLQEMKMNGIHSSPYMTQELVDSILIE